MRCAVYNRFSSYHSIAYDLFLESLSMPRRVLFWFAVRAAFSGVSFVINIPKFSFRGVF